MIEGTTKNWTKLKVINKTDSTIEYLTKTIDNGTESIDIETFYEANVSITANNVNTVEKHKVTSDSGTILLDGKKMNSETQTVAPSSISSATNHSISVNSGATWYFVDKIEGSVNTNVATLGICISVLSMAIGSTAAAVVGLAVDIFGLKIPYTWYTKWKYSDKKVYQPMYLLNIYTYSDAKRTLQTGYTEYVL